MGTRWELSLGCEVILFDIRSLFAGQVMVLCNHFSGVNTIAEIPKSLLTQVQLEALTVDSHG